MMFQIEQLLENGGNEYGDQKPHADVAYFQPHDSLFKHINGLDG